MSFIHKLTAQFMLAVLFVTETLNRRHGSDKRIAFDDRRNIECHIDIAYFEHVFFYSFL